LYTNEDGLRFFPDKHKSVQKNRNCFESQSIKIKKIHFVLVFIAFYYSFNRLTDFNRPSYENTRPHAKTAFRNKTAMDISAYPTVLYTVGLVCNGQIQQSKTLVKQ